MKYTRKKTVFSGIAAAAFIGASSVAFACLTQLGDSTLTTPSGSGATVIGNQTGHGWCAWPTPAASANQGDTVTVAVTPATCGANSSQLATATYQIRLQNLAGSSAAWTVNASNQWEFTPNQGCFRAGIPHTVLSSTFSVTNGFGTTTVTIPSGASTSLADEASGICVGNSTNGTGIFAPLVIT